MAPEVSLRATLRQGSEALDRLPSDEQAVLLTVPLLLLYGASAWYVSVPVSMLAITALLLPSIRTHGGLWLLVGSLQLAGVAVDWSTADNHKYLIAYWTLAIALSALAPPGQAGLRTSGRLLIGLTFAFALAWKLMAPDFVSGAFFQHTILFDERFQVRTGALGLVPQEAIRLNQLARAALLDSGGNLEQVHVACPPSVPLLASFFTGWMLLTEGLIALLFLVPPSWRVARGREAALVFFVVAAYGVAPVLGFASVLSAMGFVQCEPDRPRPRQALLLTFIALQVFRVPWANLLSDGP